MSMHFRRSLNDPRPPNPWRDVGLLCLALAFLVCLWLLWGCGERAAAAVATGVAAEALPALPAPTSTAAADADLKALRTERDDLARRLDLKDGDIRRVEKERDDLGKQDLRRRLAWLGGIVLIGVLACVGLWFVLPAGLKSWAVYGGLGCLGIAGAAFALRALVPYLELIGWGLVAAAAAFGLWKLSRFKRAGQQGAAAFDRLEEAFVGMKDWIPADKHVLVDDLLADVKHQAALAQENAGVRGVLAAIRGKDRFAPTTPPPAGTPPPLPVVSA